MIKSETNCCYGFVTEKIHQDLKWWVEEDEKQQDINVNKCVRFSLHRNDPTYKLYKGTFSPLDITAISEGCDDELSKGATFYMFWSN